MLKLLFLSFALVLTIDTIYSFRISAIDGSEINFNDYQGKKILIVNTASQSPYVNQLANLETLYQKYKDSLVVIAIPSNSFGNEQNSAATIQSLVKSHYGAQYLLADKMQVTGQNASSIYKWLTGFSNNGVMGKEVEGDFQKYLIGTDGKLIGYFIPGVDPMDSIIQKSIENKLLIQ